jgi:hypothetical protein
MAQFVLSLEYFIFFCNHNHVLIHTLLFIIWCGSSPALFFKKKKCSFPSHCSRRTVHGVATCIMQFVDECTKRSAGHAGAAGALLYCLCLLARGCLGRRVHRSPNSEATGRARRGGYEHDGEQRRLPLPCPRHHHPLKSSRAMPRRG